MAFGRLLSRVLQAPCVVYLEGDLGAGKTTLVRGFLRGRDYTGAVRSPTYTLVEPYPLEDSIVYHLDLYRLGDPEELEYLGLRDLLDETAVILVEWPERGRGWLAPADLRIAIRHRAEGRDLTILAESGKGKQILDALLTQIANGSY